MGGCRQHPGIIGSLGVRACYGTLIKPPRGGGARLSPQSGKSLRAASWPAAARPGAWGEAGWEVLSGGVLVFQSEFFHGKFCLGLTPPPPHAVRGPQDTDKRPGRVGKAENLGAPLTPGLGQAPAGSSEKGFQALQTRSSCLVPGDCGQGLRSQTRGRGGQQRAWHWLRTGH